MARVLSTAIVLALLAATAAAFAITEGAKLEHSPITRTKVDQLFSPAGTAVPAAHIRFRLRTRERISVWIEDGHGTNVRNLLTNRTFKAGSNLDLVWDGVADNGIVEPDGVYKPVVKLARSHRVITLPSPIRIDTKPPVITVHHPLYPILSPDGDGRHDTLHGSVHAERARPRDPPRTRPAGRVHTPPEGIRDALLEREAEGEARLVRAGTCSRSPRRTAPETSRRASRSRSRRFAT